MEGWTNESKKLFNGFIDEWVNGGMNGVLLLLWLMCGVY